MKMIGWFDMAMRYSSKTNNLIFTIAALGTCSFGAVRPLFAVFFGKATNGIGVANEEGGFDMLENSAIRMIYVGIFGGICQFLQTGAF